jgi:hypothetical protein
MEPILMWTWWRIIQLSHVSNELLHLHNPNFDMKSQHCPIKNGYYRPITNQFCQWRTFCWFPLYISWWLNQVRSPFLDCQISMFHNLHPQVWFNFHFWGWNPHLSWWNHHFSWWNPSFFEGKRPANSAKPSSVSDGRSSRPSARSGDHIESTLGFHHNHV